MPSDKNHKSISMEKLHIVEKAFNVWHEGMLDDHPEYGYRMEDLPVYYAETPSKAKSQCSIVYDYHINDEPAKFTDIRVKRCKSSDKVLFEGNVIERYNIDYILEERSRNEELDKLVQDNPSAMAYIRKRGAYYRPNHRGYTERQSKSGIYTIQEAVKEVKGCSLGDYMTAIVIDNAEHNEMLNKEITDLESRII